MLTLKLITEETDRVIRGLEKKHFKGAKEVIDEVLTVDKRRREAQQQLDKNLSEAKKMAAQIGGLMKEGKKDEAEAAFWYELAAQGGDPQAQFATGWFLLTGTGVTQNKTLGLRWIHKATAQGYQPAIDYCREHGLSIY